MAAWLISDREVTKDGVTVAKSIDLKSMPEMERAYHMCNIYIQLYIYNYIYTHLIIFKFTCIFHQKIKA
jgi:hypothetical protein